MKSLLQALARVDIYEVVNAARRESLIAVTAGDLTALRLRLRAAPPPAVAHWGAGDALEFVRLAARLNPLSAERLLSLSLKAPQTNGWRLFPWRV